jgi:hypothetical protein
VGVWAEGENQRWSSHHLHKSILNVNRILCRGLDEGDVGLSCKLARKLGLNLALARQVALVPDEQLVDILRRVAINSVQPSLHMLERLRVGHVVDDDDAVGAEEVATRDGEKAVVPSRVPDLQLDGLAIELDCADPVVDADGREVHL